MARPTKPIKFPRAEVKRANERLRKLETVNRMAQSSEAYKSVERLATDPNAYSSKFYRTNIIDKNGVDTGKPLLNKDGTPAIRFITPAQYNKLSRYDQMKFDEIVNNFLENRTTTKLGIEKVRRDNYDSFMKNHPNLHWTQEEYENFWKNYCQAQDDKKDVIAYTMLTQIFNAVTPYSNGLTDNKISELVHYNNKELRYSEAPSKTTLKTRKFRE